MCHLSISQMLKVSNIMNNSILLSCIQCIFGVDINCTIMIHVHKETTFEI